MKGRLLVWLVRRLPASVTALLAATTGDGANSQAYGRETVVVVKISSTGATVPPPTLLARSAARVLRFLRIR